MPGRVRGVLPGLSYRDRAPLVSPGGAVRGHIDTDTPRTQNGWAGIVFKPAPDGERRCTERPSVQSPSLQSGVSRSSPWSADTGADGG